MFSLSAIFLVIRAFCVCSYHVHYYFLSREITLLKCVYAKVCFYREIHETGKRRKARSIHKHIIVLSVEIYLFFTRVNNNIHYVQEYNLGCTETLLKCCGWLVGSHMRCYANNSLFMLVCKGAYIKFSSIFGRAVMIRKKWYLLHLTFETYARGVKKRVPTFRTSSDPKNVKIQALRRLPSMLVYSLVRASSQCKGFLLFVWCCAQIEMDAFDCGRTHALLTACLLSCVHVAFPTEPCTNRGRHDSAGEYPWLNIYFACGTWDLPRFYNSSVQLFLTTRVDLSSGGMGNRESEDASSILFLHDACCIQMIMVMALAARKKRSNKNESYVVT